MVERRTIPRAIRDEAARWVADRDAGLLEPAGELEFKRWLDADPLHRQAFELASQIWTALDAVPETPGMRPVRQGPSRARATAWRRGRDRRWIAAAIRPRKAIPALAACFALLLLSVATDLPMRLRADAITATGEQRLVALPDGSTIRLNTRSAVSFDYGPDARRIRLLSGEAAFDVRPDPSRPFLVEAASGEARALGTRFIVREQSDGAVVTVTEHRVALTYRNQRRIVGEGQRLSYDTLGGLGVAHAVDIADAEGWTRGRLIVVDRPLAEVVAELGRYHSGYIHVSADIASLAVSGNFRIDDPLAALDQIQNAVRISSTRVTSRLILLHK